MARLVRVEIALNLRRKFLRLRIGLAEGIYCHMLHNLRLQRTVAIVRAGIGDLVDRLHAFDHLAKGGIAAIQMGGVLVHDEELGAGGVIGLRSCHGQNALRVL